MLNEKLEIFVVYRLALQVLEITIHFLQIA